MRALPGQRCPDSWRPWTPLWRSSADIKTAVSEAVTNCIVHAYADRIGIVYIAADSMRTAEW